MACPLGFEPRPYSFGDCRATVTPETYRIRRGLVAIFLYASETLVRQFSPFIYKALPV